MKQYESVGSMIKWIIKCRNKTIKITASDLGLKYTTFDEQLNRNIISADTLLRLAAYLDIDLNWMMAALGYYGPITLIEKKIMPRMSPEFRAEEAKHVYKILDQLIYENPTSTPTVRRELLNSFSKNTFYLLDVLAPENKIITMTMEREQYRYRVDSPNDTNGIRERCMMTVTRGIGRAALPNEYRTLDIIIEERKDNL